MICPHCGSASIDPINKRLWAFALFCAGFNFAVAVASAAAAIMFQAPEPFLLSGFCVGVMHFNLWCASRIKNRGSLA